MQLAFFASAWRPSHAWQHTWVQTCKHMCACALSVTAHITHGHQEERCGAPARCPLTALVRLSAFDMCSKSTKGWAKNSAKVIRASGFLSSSRSRRSLQSLDTRAPGGSCYTKRDLIKLHSFNSTVWGKRAAFHCLHITYFYQRIILALRVNEPHADVHSN